MKHERAHGWSSDLMKNNGFALVTVLLFLLVLAATALTLNSRAAIQGRMAFNQTQGIQAHFGRLSAVEWALWKLGQDPAWRNTENGGFNYLDPESKQWVTYPASVGTDGDVITISAKGSFRYDLDTPPPFLNKKPYGLAVDVSGNSYFADRDNHTIWKVDAGGVVTRIAGNGTSGFSGDGGTATSAQLNGPRGVCVDQWGNIYIADTDNHRIRKITPFGIIITFAGTGVPGYSSTEDNGPAVSARINKPAGVFVDNATNTLYIADTENDRVRKVAVATGIIGPVAGTGEAGYSSNEDNGPATSAKLNKPAAITVNGGNVFIADRGNSCIRKVNTSTGVITTEAGRCGSEGNWGDNIPATWARLTGPAGLHMAGNYLFIADTGNSCIRKVNTSTGVITTEAGLCGWAGYGGDNGPAIWARLDHPRGVAMTSGGVIAVADTMNSTIRKVAGGTITTPFAITPAPGLNGPQKIAVYHNRSKGKTYLYIADTLNHHIRRVDMTTNTMETIAGTGTAGYRGDGGLAKQARLNGPQGLFADDTGIYIADTDNCLIRKLDLSDNPTITRFAGRVKDGDVDCGPDSGATTSSHLQKPRGVFRSSAGYVYIADTGNKRIRRVAPGGGVTSITSPTFVELNGVAVDPSGNIIAADRGANRLFKINAQGAVTSIAGTGAAGYSGDGGPAASAQLNQPEDVALDGSGNIFISDSDNCAIRKIDKTTNVITLFAGRVRGGTPECGFNGDNITPVEGKLNRPGGISAPTAGGGGRVYIADTANNRIRTLSWKKVKDRY